MMLAALVPLLIAQTGLPQAGAPSRHPGSGAFEESSTDEQRARLAFLQARLDESVEPARLWFFGWTMAYTAGLSARTALAIASDDPGVRIDSRVGMVTLGAGLASTLLLYPRSIDAAAELRAASRSSPEDQRARLVLAERLLVESAARERFGRSPIPHLAGLAVNLSGGLYLWLVEDRLTSALVAFGGGMAVTELKIFTQPMTASRALEKYRRGGAGSAVAPRPAVDVGVYALPWGMVVAGSY